jgi:alpha 1,3-glucosidase
MLPTWYTAVKRANETGEPVVMPLWAEFGEIADLHKVDTSVLVADALLVAPVMKSDVAVLSVIKPPGRWYHFRSGDELLGNGEVPAGLDEIPVFVRGGKIVAQYSKVAMSTREILARPLTLYIALDESQKATGELYLDDGETYDYVRKVFLRRQFTYANNLLTCRTLGTQTMPKELVGLKINRIVVYGLTARGDAPTMIVEGMNLGFETDFSLTVEKSASEFPLLPVPILLIGFVVLVAILLIVVSRRRRFMGELFGIKDAKYQV